MPINIRHRSIMPLQNMLNARLARQIQIPYEQFLARGGDDEVGSGGVRVPLDIGYFPCSALREETGRIVRVLEINYEETFASRSGNIS